MSNEIFFKLTDRIVLVNINCKSYKLILLMSILLYNILCTVYAVVGIVTACNGVTNKQLLFILKGQWHEIFDPRFISSNNTPWAPDSRAKAFSNSASNSPRYDRFSNAKIVHAVSMTPHARKFLVR
jgi:hypothetical protein